MEGGLCYDVLGLIFYYAMLDTVSSIMRFPVRMGFKMATSKGKSIKVYWILIVGSQDMCAFLLSSQP